MAYNPQAVWGTTTSSFLKKWEIDFWRQRKEKKTFRVFKLMEDLAPSQKEVNPSKAILSADNFCEIWFFKKKPKKLLFKYKPPKAFTQRRRRRPSECLLEPRRIEPPTPGTRRIGTNPSYMSQWVWDWITFRLKNIFQKKKKEKKRTCLLFWFDWRLSQYILINSSSETSLSNSKNCFWEKGLCQKRFSLLLLIKTDLKIWIEDIFLLNPCPIQKDIVRFNIDNTQKEKPQEETHCFAQPKTKNQNQKKPKKNQNQKKPKKKLKNALSPNRRFLDELSIPFHFSIFDRFQKSIFKLWTSFFFWIFFYFKNLFSFQFTLNFALTITTTCNQTCGNGLQYCVFSEKITQSR